VQFKQGANPFAEAGKAHKNEGVVTKRRRTVEQRAKQKARLEDKKRK